MRILFLLLISSVAAFGQCGILVLNPVTFNLDCTGPAASGTVTSIIIAGTANQITASGTCTITTSGTCTLSLTPTPVVTPGTSPTLTGPRGYAICTGTCTVSVPAPVAGYEFCVVNDNNVATAITLSALGSSAMYENSARTAYGTAGTGTLVVAAALKNKVCLLGRDSTHYLLLSNDGGAITVN